MIPISIHFAGDTIFDPTELLMSRRISGPIPENWSRISFEYKIGKFDDLLLLDIWLRDNISGKWARYQLMDTKNKYTVVIAFENRNDAVMFKLADGATEFNKKKDFR